MATADSLKRRRVERFGGIEELVADPWSRFVSLRNNDSSSPAKIPVDLVLPSKIAEKMRLGGIGLGGIGEIFYQQMQVALACQISPTVPFVHATGSGKTLALFSFDVVIFLAIFFQVCRFFLPDRHLFFADRFGPRFT